MDAVVSYQAGESEVECCCEENRGDCYGDYLARPLSVSGSPF